MADIPSTQPVEARPPLARPTVPYRQSVLSTVRRPARADPVVTTNYSYVVHDLRRIAVLAAAGFTILVVLSFIIR